MTLLFRLACCGLATVLSTATFAAAPRLAAFTEPKVYTWAEQGWSAEERDLWNHTSAGQALLPYRWLKVLERADNQKHWLDEGYMKSLGFLFEPKTPHNPERLPIGFAIAPKDSPVAGYLGMTCTSCHTGQVSYRGKGLRIVAGAASFDVSRLIGDMYAGLAKTYSQPDKWQRFAKGVLGAELNPENEAKLKSEVLHEMQDVQWDYAAEAKAPGEFATMGPGRMDPFNRIGNHVVGFGTKVEENYVKSNSPVNAPTLWNVSKYSWVHFGANMSQPMARNVLQVLGNGGRTNFVDANGQANPTPARWDTSIDLKALDALEAGFRKVTPPLWPKELFGPYDHAKALKGKALFTELCSRCHAIHPVAAPDNQIAQWAIPAIAISEIGTDPNESQTFAKRLFKVSKLTDTDGPAVSGPEALTFLTEKLKNHGYDKLGLSAEQRHILDGNGRPNRVRALEAYRAAPLDGIWASAPYLHNGSVPNLYELLSQASERSQTFWVGTFEYDPIKLGYVSSPIKGGFLLDTKSPGSSSAGHEFTSKRSGQGVIGRGLNHDERMELIEYIKALPEMPPEPLSPTPVDWH